MQFDTRSLWIYIHFTQLQLDLLESMHSPEESAGPKQKRQEVQERQEAQAIAIVDINSNQLCQINADAYKRGLKLGMGLASASLLCSDLLLHEYNADIERSEINNIANHLYLVTSDIVLCPPNALLLRAQNMLSLYEGLAGYWQVIRQCLQEHDVDFVAASAYSVQAAKMIALSLAKNTLTRNQAMQKKRLKTKTKQAKYFISEDRNKIAKLLARCSLNVSDIDDKDITKLARIGIKSYDDLQQIPAAELANRVSRFSMSILNELMGKQAAKLKFYQPQSRYHDYLELLYEISLSDKLLPVIGRCLDKLSQFLLIRNAHSMAINIAFFQREHDKLTLTFNSIRPIYKRQDWLDIISLQLESVSFESPVYAISIDCEKYEVAQTANDDMFTEKSTHVAAMTLLSRLQSKLGQSNIKRVHFVEDFRPEYSLGQHPLIDKAGARSKVQGQALSIFTDRPGLLLPEPEPLTLDVQVIKGPERIQTGWWDDKNINRDYYIGQSKDGQQVWIFKTPNKQWYLHGYFI